MGTSRMSADDAGTFAVVIIVLVEIVMLVVFIAVPEVVDHLEAFFAPIAAVITRPIAAVFQLTETALNRLAATVRRWTG